MDIQTVSTKQLREEMPAIKARLQQGESFYWIDRSKPIGRIEPVVSTGRRQKTMDKKEWKRLVEKLAGGFSFKKNYSPEDLNNIIDQEYEI